MEREKQRLEKIRDMLNSSSIDELSYIIGRYCGKQNQILCEKKYGYSIPIEMAQAIHADKAMELYLLSDEIPVKIEE